MVRMKKESTVSTPAKAPSSTTHIDEEFQEYCPIFQHVMSKVLKKKPTDALYKALTVVGIDDISGLVSMDPDDVATLHATEDTTLHLGDRNIMK